MKVKRKKKAAPQRRTYRKAGGLSAGRKTTKRRTVRRKGLAEGFAEGLDITKKGTAGNVIASGLAGAAIGYGIQKLFPNLSTNQKYAVQAIGTVVIAAAGMPVVASGLGAITLYQYLNQPATGGTTMAEEGDFFVDPAKLTGGMPLVLPMAEDEMADNYTLADSYTLSEGYSLEDSYTLAEGYDLSEYVIEPGYNQSYY